MDRSSWDSWDLDLAQGTPDPRPDPSSSRFDGCLPIHSTETPVATTTETSPPHKVEQAVNPLNPKGLKPYVRCCLAHVPHHSISTYHISSCDARLPRGTRPISSHICRCCACPETKSVRDECFLRSSPEEAGVKCRELVEAHKACMRGYGFKV